MDEQGSSAHPRPVRRRSASRPIRASDFLCRKCGYDFRGLNVESRCPECGTPIIRSFDREKPTSGMAIASFVLGILSVVSCVGAAIPGLVLGPLAIVFYIVSDRKSRAGLAGGATRGLGAAGLICGIIGSLISYGFWLFALVSS